MTIPITGAPLSHDAYDIHRLVRVMDFSTPNEISDSDQGAPRGDEFQRRIEKRDTCEQPNSLTDSPAHRAPRAPKDHKGYCEPYDYQDKHFEAPRNELLMINLLVMSMMDFGLRRALGLGLPT